MLCLCCGLPRTIYRDSASAQQVCDDCKRHNTGNWRSVVELHAKWVIEHLAGVKGEMQRRRFEEVARDAENKQRIEALNEQLAEVSAIVRRDYADAPLGDVQTWLRSELVDEAQAAVRGAYRSRSVALGVLWNLDELHHESPGGKTCVCGKKVSACRELKFLADTSSALYRWEQQQLERLNKGLECGLPREHPEMIKRRGYSYYPRVG